MFRTPAPLAAAALLLAAGSAHAQLTTFTISDGSASLTVNGVSGERTTSAGGSANLTTGTGVSPVDHLFQNFFWYRATGDTREYALSNISGVSTAGSNRARIVYSEPSNNGATANALLVELEYTISDLTAGSTAPERTMLTVGFKIQNLTGANLNVQFYNYNDLDLAGTIGNDSCAVTGADDHIQTVSDPSTSQYSRTTAAYVVSATNRINYQVEAYPAIINDLTDAASNNFTDSAVSFGPGDYSGGNQWGTTLAPAGSAQSSLVGTVTLIIETNDCEADVDNNGAVNSSDISAYLTTWLQALSGGCP